MRVVYSFGNYELDLRLFELRREGARVPVEPQVFDVLSLLVECRDRVVAKNEILQRVWADRFISESTLASRLTAARKAIEDDAKSQRLIKTVHGRGYRFVGEVQELGGSEPAEEKSGTTALPAAARPAPAPSILGRGEELERLRRCLDTAMGGRRRVVFVTGEAGLGKTTVVESFVDEQRAKGEAWIAGGQCLEHSGAGEAYMPVLEALGRLCGAPQGGPLVDLLVRRAPTWMAQMPWLLSDAQLEALKRRTEASRKERMLRELGEALEAVTAERPLIFVLEDLHWSDPSTVELISWIAARTDPCRLLLLATYRPEEVAATGHRVAAVHQRLRLRDQCEDLTLPMLGEAAVRAYLERRVPDGPLPGRLAPLVLARSEGNPLFMVNLVEAWITEGLLVEREQGHWAVEGEIGQLGRRVPDTLRQLIELRLAELPEDKRKGLECASIAGKSFSAALVAAGCEHPVEEAEQCLTRMAEEGRFLRARRTIEWPDGTVAAGFEFVHSLYQDVIYENVPAAQRAQLHRRIGARIERAYGERAAERAAELALHFARGQEPLRAVEFHHKAGLQALDRSAYAEACGHFEDALALVAETPPSDQLSDLELDVRMFHAPALAAIRGWASPEVEAAFDSARELCQKLGDEVRIFPILYGLAEMFEVRGEFEACQRVLERHSPNPDWPQLEYNEMMACSVFHQGEFDAALDHADRALSAYDADAPDPYTKAYGESAAVRTHVWLALSLWFKGRSEEAVAELMKGVAKAEGPDLLYSLSAVRSQLASLYQLRREPEPALRWARDTIDVATRHGFPYRVALGKLVEGWVLATDRGEPARGIELIREAIETAESVGVSLDYPYFLALLAEAHHAAGDVDEGLRVLAEALQWIQSTRSYFYEPELHRLKGLLLLAEGPKRSEEEAERCFERALASARETGAKSLALRAALSLGRLRADAGKEEEAKKTVRETVEWVGDVDLAELREAAEF